MSQRRNIKFGTELVTFYAPSFWGGAGDLDAITTSISQSGWDPLRFWERILDGSQEAGLDGIEVTFPPGDWHYALAAYGSAQSFASALRDRGLELASGYFGTSVPGEDRQPNIRSPPLRAIGQRVTRAATTTPTMSTIAEPTLTLAPKSGTNGRCKRSTNGIARIVAQPTRHPRRIPTSVSN